METDYIIKGNCIFRVNDIDKKILTKRDFCKHLYRILHSFCVNSIIVSESFLSKTQDYTIVFYNDNYTATITIKKLINFMEKYNCWITFGDEKQIAIPIAILEFQGDNYKTIGLSVDEFEEELKTSKYSAWRRRIK